MNTNMETFNLLYKEVIEKDFEENLKTAKESLYYLDKSTAKYKGETIYSLYMAKAFPDDVVDYLKEASEIMYGLLKKVMNEYIEKEDYRKLFGFQQELEELILDVPPYQNILPIARLDIFLNEKDLSFKFCEFNADGCSSMNEDRELNIALQKTAAYKELSRDYEIESFELFETWVKEFMDIYKTYPDKVEQPNIGIVDFLEKGCSMEEFEEFKKSFQRAGHHAQICEIRDMKFDGEHLYAPDGTVIHAIYRRAVTSDIMEHFEEVEDFMNAVKNHKVCLIGSFCTQIIHNKILFYLLHCQRTQDFLDKEEIQFINRHIPYTVSLTEQEVFKNAVLDNKDKWIIKPEDSYGARGIFAGLHFSLEQWKKIVEENMDTCYILQEFVLPYQSFNIDFKKKEPKFRKYSNLTGMYVYNGKFAGIYSRQSEHEIISSQYDENDVASVKVSKKEVKSEDFN
ncbi:glutathionylspermidine synthase family protein [Anaerosacchariphilus polymeriproducens]|uniref:Glutathionylspermidine synthase pre-ATP-grasp-like domain-containing protein n=1 Tax=Anaerosacchariphilus polymeriproducens TaxID=1812858 RepID=A0A371AYR3_9FIRM|nr:glutathionylspermidine synthase family protein [Anaerosacchariphilus polymeriproducens]RDU24738.1 hypothetical protein DWV06_04520 [Anaerosacchariphilus polymeriproducens]